jgi:hypothetical protein
MSISSHALTAHFHVLEHLENKDLGIGLGDSYQVIDNRFIEKSQAGDR